MNIPDSVTSTNYEEILPQSVAEFPQGTEDPETLPYEISFVRYNDKLCEIDRLDSNKAKKALKVLKEIGTKIFRVTDFRRNNIDRLPIANVGEYKKLYSGLSPDTDLKELKLQQEARIFYFDLEPEKKLYIVEITQNHFETSKVRK